MFDLLAGLVRRLFDLLRWLSHFREPADRPALRDPTKVEINVRSPGGRSILATVDKRSSVADVKRELGPRLCPPSDDLGTMRVIFAGKELSDEVKMEDCDFGPKSTIHVVFGRRGGRLAPSSVAASPLPEVLASSLAEPPESPEDDDDDDDDEEDAAESDEESDAAREEAVDDDDDEDGASVAEEDGGRGEPDTDDEYVPKKKVVSFYVLCSGNACAGKLRVRCELCKEGAVTVLRDPESWDDVLKPRRVQATCENATCPSVASSCSSTFAEFYFKCAEHGASDLSPLPHVRQNSRNVPCLGCTGVENPVFVFPCAVGHVVCVECFVAYCNSWLNERRFVVRDVGYTVGCPAGCPESWVDRSQHFKLLGKDQYERYQRFAAEDFVLASGGALCPQPGCGMGILPSDDVCGDRRRVVCGRDGGCGFVFCRDCRMGYHLGPCDAPVGLPFRVGDGGGGDAPSGCPSGFSPANVIAERANLSAWDGGLGAGGGGPVGDVSSVTAVRLLSKPCPSCRVSTERDGGCMHMSCRCGFQWCWVCQTEWTRDCMASHWFL